MAKRHLDSDMSHMELDNDSQINQSTTKLGMAPDLPPPTAEMRQFTREIRVVDHIPDSSVYADNLSPPAFKRQKADNSMELTGIQNFVPVSTPFKRSEFNFELPKLSSSVLDTSALDAAFGHEDEEDEQTVELQVYVDPENEPPKQHDPSPERKPLAPKALSPVQEVTEESSGIQNITAPIEAGARQPISPLRSPVIGASHTAPIRSVPATPRHGMTSRDRHSRRNSQSGLHRGLNTPQRAKTPSQSQKALQRQTPQSHTQPAHNGTPSTSRASRSNMKATPTRQISISRPQRTPLKSPQVISIPSSPDRIGSPRRFLSDDESFLNVDPNRLESVDDLMVHLAINDFNPTSVDEVLPAKEVELIGLSQCQEIMALTLQGEIDRLISEGQSLETQLKKYTEKMDVRAIMARYQTYDRKDRLQLKHRFRTVYDHLQAKAEVKTAEAELEVSRQMLDRLKDLKLNHDKRYADFVALRQKSKDIEQEIGQLRNIQGDEVTLDEEIQDLKKQVDAKNARLSARKDEVTTRALKNQSHERIWSQHQHLRDPTKESTDEAWHRRQFVAKLETMKTVHGILNVSMWKNGVTVIMSGLEISSYLGESELRFKKLGYSAPLGDHFYRLLNKFNTLKDNVAIWKRYLSINTQLKQLRRLQFHKWVQENKETLVFQLTAEQGTVNVQFSKNNITIEWLDLKDKSLEAQALKLGGENALTLLASKLNM